MNGQRWEPCPRCGREPVCNECGYCERHCTCASDAEDRKEISEFSREYPGFLENVIRHHEEGAKER